MYIYICIYVYMYMHVQIVSRGSPTAQSDQQVRGPGPRSAPGGPHRLDVWRGDLGKYRAPVKGTTALKWAVYGRLGSSKEPEVFNGQYMDF